MLCCLELQLPRVPSREAEGTHLLKKECSVLLLFDGLMHGMVPVITERFYFYFHSLTLLNTVRVFV